jgi:CBS domain-containing protein
VNLTDLLSPGRVVVPLAAPTWAEGLRLLLDACIADGRVRDVARLEEVVREAWPADTVTMGPHAVLPHFRTDAVDGVTAALGVAPAPMTGTNPELPGARIMVLIVAPPGDPAAYLQAVAAFARVLARPDVVDALHAARTPAEILALPALRAVRLEGPLQVGDVVPANPFALTPETTLEQAARQLLAHGIAAAPVIGPAREVVGMLSLQDLLRFLGPAYVQRVQGGERPAPPHGPLGRPADPRGMLVRDAMTRNVLCMAEDESLAEATSLLANKPVAGVPVVRDGMLCGFLTRAEIVRKLLG